MTGPNRISAFTLAEILVVLVLMGVLMAMGSGFTRRTGNTFTAQQYVKKYIQQARILRRKSMLVTRNSSSNKWVHSIGLQFIKDTETEEWDMKQVKALDTGTSSRFYKPFPKNELDQHISIEFLETSLDYKLPPGFSLLIDEIQDDVPERITRPCNTLTILYESINGKMHVYCSGTENPFETTIGGDGIDSSKDAPKIQLTIAYEDGWNYPNKMILKNNGEIHTTQK